MENDTKLINISGDTLEEVASEFLAACAATGSFLCQNSTSKVPKPYGKLILTGGDKPYESSFTVEWPDVRIDTPDVLLDPKTRSKASTKLMPRFGKLDVRFTDLQEPVNRKQVIATRAATVTTELARLIAEAKRLNIPVPGMEDNSAGEE